MRYLSVCSGIEAATVAWHPLGWEAAGFSEIEKFPRELLTHHYPNVPLHGDFTTIGEKDYGAIDLLVGGTPCQSFSVAGLRQGFADDRGNLTLAFLQLLKRKTPKWVVWENVPGVLSHDSGRSFGAFLGGLGECGYGFAYRVLDAQYFRVPQRRRRVFVVGCLGDWRSAAEVLFEPEGLQGDIVPRRKKRIGSAGTISGSIEGPQSVGDCFDDSIVGALCRRDYKGVGNQDLATGRGLYCKTYGIMSNIINRKPEDGGNGFGISEEIVGTLTRSDRHAIANRIVRRLTPLEHERLQGFPDNYTKISEDTPDTPRYAALGNSMAVPVMKWIGERIQMVENYEL